MHILGITEYHCLGDLYWRLTQQGHQVRVYVAERESHALFAGMVQRCEDWRAELPWVRAAGEDGVIVFESAHQGALQDALRRDGYAVVGGGAWGDRIEGDRQYGQQVMREAGMQVAPSWAFSDYAQALAFLGERPMRVVYKTCEDWAASTRNYVGEMEDGSDVAALIALEQSRAPAGHRPHFILMQHLQGIEIGIGGYFNGHEFLRPLCLDWEHKRFFPGDLGELTGEMGTLVTYRHYETLFEQTLARLVEPLRHHGYCGYINLNTIINAKGVWPLEFTSRFGYPGFAICDALHTEGWAGILKAMATGAAFDIPTRPGYAVGVVLTIPPFPYEAGTGPSAKGIPIFFKPDLSAAERAQLHYGEVGLEGQQLVTAGSMGYVMVATGVGADVPAAQREAYAIAAKVVIPKLRYRSDIGDRFVQGDQAQLRRWGYLP
ncbi:MAG: phosphoribosylglycinamide synthetase C domain-containing protein [Pseudomonadota bacterium]